MSKIASVETVLLTAPGRHIGMPDTQRSAALVEIADDDGVTGLGETYAGLYVAPVVPAVVDLYRPLLLGASADDPSAVLEAMRLRSMRWGMTGLPVQVVSGIEMALWDLCAKRLKVPAYRLFGGLAQDRLRLYASAYAAPYPSEATGRKVLHYVQQGFTAVKLATGFWDRPRDPATTVTQLVAEESEKLAAIRSAVGATVDIALDHHGANNPIPWTADVATAVIGALEPFQLLWFEQPCASHDLDGYAKLRRSVATPIAGGEDATTVHEIQRFLERDALDVVQPDVAWMGVTAVRQAIGLAQARGVRSSLHVAGTAVARAANYHFAFSDPRIAIVEFQVERNPLFEELLEEPLDFRDGYLYPPTMPGFGVRLTRETRERFPFAPRPWRRSNKPGGVGQGT